MLTVGVSVPVKLRQLLSLLSYFLMQRLIASHHCHPPFALCSPQMGCFYGNSRIPSRPMSAVSLFLSSAAGFRLFSLWRYSFFYLDSLFFLPGYKMEDETVLFIKGRVVFVEPISLRQRSLFSVYHMIAASIFSNISLCIYLISILPWFRTQSILGHG